MISHCKTAQCDSLGCSAERVLVGYAAAQHAALILREEGWYVGERMIHDPAPTTYCPEHVQEVSDV